MKCTHIFRTACWILISTLLLSACRYEQGSGNIISETRNVDVFEEIKVSEGIEATVSNGPLAVRVEADDNLIGYIRTRVSNGKLKVDLDNMNVDDAHLKVFITAPDIRNVSASSGAEVDIEGVLKNTQAVEVDASSAAEIRGSIDAPEVQLESSSGAELEIKGRTRTLSASASSGSRIDAEGLLSETATVRSSSGSTVRVFASVQLTAKASSGSSIHHRGGAKTDIKQSSGGVVRAAD